MPVLSVLAVYPQFGSHRLLPWLGTVRAPSLHGSYPASSLLRAHPTPSRPPTWLWIPTSVSCFMHMPRGSLSSRCLLSVRAVPSNPGEPNGCQLPCHQPMVLASSSLEDWPLSISVTRPKWVQAFALRLAPSPHRVLRPLDYSRPDARGATWLTVHSMANSFQSASQTTISLTHQRTQRGRRGNRVAKCIPVFATAFLCVLCDLCG